MPGALVGCLGACVSAVCVCFGLGLRGRAGVVGPSARCSVCWPLPGDWGRLAVTTAAASTTATVSASAAAVFRQAILTLSNRPQAAIHDGKGSLECTV